MVLDFFDVDAAFAPLHTQLDHHTLNEVIENPTAENIAVWIFDRVKQILPQLSDVAVFETPDCRAAYTGV
jgi:6-pyruvoyltetrahydropterin/6-carboxytetrahydropterin synthase